MQFHLHKHVYNFALALLFLSSFLLNSLIRRIVLAAERNQTKKQTLCRSSWFRFRVDTAKFTALTAVVAVVVVPRNFMTFVLERQTATVNYANKKQDVSVQFRFYAVLDWIDSIDSLSCFVLLFWMNLLAKTTTIHYFVIFYLFSNETRPLNGKILYFGNRTDLFMLREGNENDFTLIVCVALLVGRRLFGVSSVLPSWAFARESRMR